MYAGVSQDAGFPKWEECWFGVINENGYWSYTTSNLEVPEHYVKSIKVKKKTLAQAPWMVEKQKKLFLKFV